MRKADFEARIRKIEIVNRVFHDSFVQTMRVVLDEVALTNENLLEIRQFRPNEVVHVEITPAQLTLGDLAAAGGAGSEAGGAGEVAGLVEEEIDEEAGRASLLARW